MERNNSYSLRGNNVLTRQKVNSMRYDTETISFLAPKIWDRILNLLIFSKEKSKNGFHGNARADFVKDMYTASRTKLTSISFSIIVKILV